MAHPLSRRQLKDFEVLGVGALRRQGLGPLRGECTLQLHRELVPAAAQASYEAILGETLEWLKPRQVEEHNVSAPVEEFLRPLLEQEFTREFPHTDQRLRSEKKRLLREYLSEFPWQGPLLTEHLRYFPLFLKRKFQDAPLYLLAQSEWLRAYLSFADFGLPPPEKGRVIANPSLQSLYLPLELPELQRTPGLYVFYYDFGRGEVRDHPLAFQEAALLDLLQEDRKFNLEQLLEQAQLQEGPAGTWSREEWLKRFSSLRDEGIILWDDLRRTADQKK